MSSSENPPTYVSSSMYLGDGPDHDELGEAGRVLDRGERADHRADGVPDEDHVAEVELAADLEHVSGIGVE